MSAALALRRLPLLLAAATLVGCSTPTGSQHPNSDDPADATTSVRRTNVEPLILADVPIGPGWDVAGDAPILADVPVGAGWDVLPVAAGAPPRLDCEPIACADA